MAEQSVESAVNRPLPPVAAICALALALIVAGGIYLAAHIPGPVALTPAIALLVVAALLVATAAVALTRAGPFAWGRFFQVGRWALLAYVVSAGILEYVFILDSVPTREMVLLTLMLVVYAVDIPLILAFSVARYQTPD
jgi:hypothetical protein